MDKFLFSQRIKSLRLKKGLSQSALASEIGITKQALSNYESGKNEPNLYTLMKISNYFHCSIDSLLSNESTYINIPPITANLIKEELAVIQDDINRLQKKLENLFKIVDEISSLTNHTEEFAEEICPNVIDLQEYKDKVKNVKCRMTPICGDVSAGEPCYAEEELIDIIPIPEDLLCSSKEYFILNIKGDSMNELFEPKELVLVEHTHYVSNNDIAIVLVGTDEATIKKVSFDGDYITLIPMSTNPIHKPKTHHIKDVCIQGKVVGKLFDVLRPSL